MDKKTAHRKLPVGRPDFTAGFQNPCRKAVIRDIKTGGNPNFIGQTKGEIKSTEVSISISILKEDIR